MDLIGLDASPRSCTSSCITTPDVDDDTVLWSSAVRPILDKSLECAHYPLPQRQGYNQFFDRCLAPALGRFPNRERDHQKWRSFMTDDFTPLEVSWSLTAHSHSIRISVEAIGHLAGSDGDPFNVRRSDELAQELQRVLPSLDLRLYELLRNEVVVDQTRLGPIQQGRKTSEPGSQIFFGFDFNESDIATKIYFMPAVKATQCGVTRLQMASDVLPSLENAGSRLRPAFSVLEEYILSASLPKPQVEIFSIDCCDPTTSRFKVYVRNQQTNFQTVCDMFTLGGRLNHAETNKELSTLRDVWFSVLGLPHTFPVDAELRPSSLSSENHRTSGVLYYFALRHGEALPEPKVYIPVRHYAKSDRQIAQGLTTLFQRYGWTDLARNYVGNLESIFTHRPLESGRGIHTYVCFSLKNGVVTIEPYFNPEIFSQAAGHSTTDHPATFGT